MNKIIVLILLIFIIVYFMLTFDIFVIKKNKLLCTPMHIYHDYKPNIATNSGNRTEGGNRTNGGGINRNEGGGINRNEGGGNRTNSGNRTNGGGINSNEGGGNRTNSGGINRNECITINNDVTYKNSENITSFYHNLDINQETYNKIKKQLQ